MKFALILIKKEKLIYLVFKLSTSLSFYLSSFSFSTAEHFYYSMDSGIEVKFVLHFYHEARLDGLSMLIMDPLFMKIYYENRPDFLYYVSVDFAERTNQDQPLRTITVSENENFNGR